MFDFPWLLMGGGGGIGLLFGSTKGETDKTNGLDELSDFLTLASLVPGLDTFTNLASIPVDLARGDYVSAGLSSLGVIPFYGEVADTAKLAKLADKAVDISRATKTATNFKSFPKKIHIGKQGKHILGHNNYQKGKSILNISTEDAQKLINKYTGKGRKIGTNRETVNFKKVIGKYVDPTTGKAYDTTVGTIHYSKSGTHLVPDKPINWRK